MTRAPRRHGEQRVILAACEPGDEKMLAALFAKRKVWTSPFGRCFTVAERACRNGSECGPAFRHPRAYRALTARCLQSRNRHTPGRRGLLVGLPMAPRGRATACAHDRSWAKASADAGPIVLLLGAAHGLRPASASGSLGPASI